MTIRPKTTYRRENDSGQTEVRKAFAVERSDIKVWKEENDQGTEIANIEVPVSSPSEDRDGDEFSEEGLESQKADFQSGTVGMWLDHGLSPETMFPDYRVLEQIGGWKDATITDDGELRATAALRPSSDDADELESMLDEGVAPVGFSVGFIVERSEEREDAENGMVFHDVDLLECSAVGIPSNPDAMVSDSAMAAAKGVVESGAYDGEPAELARAMTREMRSLPYINEQRNQSMTAFKYLKQEGLEEIADAISEYLDADETSSDDAVPELVEWVSEEIGEETASLVSDAAQAALDSTDAESIDELTVSEFNGFVEETLESDDDGDTGDSGGGDDDDDDDDDGNTDSADPAQLRSQIRDALDDVLLDALTDEEALRSLISEEVREALSEEEFSVEVTEDFKETLAEELRSELFKDTGGDGRSGPAPAGTIGVYEPDDDGKESGGDGSGGTESGGSGSAQKPSPAIGGN